jgi:transcription-repair coupling factor (superfamily II helicase)
MKSTSKDINGAAGPGSRTPALLSNLAPRLDEKRTARNVRGGAARRLVAGCRTSTAGLLLARTIKEIVEREGHRAGEPKLVVVTPTESRARQLARELDFFLGPSPFDEPTMEVGWGLVLPENPEMAYGDIGPDLELELERMAVCFRLSQGFCGPAVIVPAAGLAQKMIPRRAFDELCDLVGPGQRLDRDELVDLLDRAGYRRMPLVEDPGCYAVRGAIVDIFPPVNRHPCRIELEGDEVISVRLYDEQSQRTTRPVDSVFIHPVRQTVLSPAARPRKKLAQAAEACHCPSSKVRFVLDQVRDRIDFFGSESLLPAFHEELDQIEAYLPSGAIWLAENLPDIKESLAETEARMEGAYDQRLELNRLSFPYDDLFVRADRAVEALEERVSTEWRTADRPAGRVPDALVEATGHFELAAEIQKATSQRGAEILAPLAQKIRSWRDEGLDVLVAASDDPSRRRLASLLRGYGLQPTELTESGVAGQGGLAIRTGHLSGGFVWPSQNLVVVSEEELFGVRKRPRPKKLRSAKPISDLSQLVEGDHVVHDLHGVGRYGGLTRQVVGGVPADLMLIEYSGSDKLYLPVHRFDQVRKYVGAQPTRAPRLDKLGGSTWQKRKGKVSEAVRQLAEQLLKLQAQRASLPGHSYPSGGQLLAAFEATFPFEETPDQAEAIEATIQDMTAERPMDRLVCGDVGYGKTEVALRAAVLAVLGGKQVALLAPTTVLVEQHLATFAERFRSFPVTVDALSRFRKGKRQARTLEKLADGRLDIVIGTHRLLSSDIKFNDLGLLIVDEEQRFGVAQKERLKEMRTQVDVLSLTATPIPRTMQMAVTGLRDLSIIATPPVDRQAIRTYVSPQNPLTITRAIQQELARGGQVFFVVPRIGMDEPDGARAREGRRPRRKASARLRSMEWWKDKLQKWVPEADIVTAHGQMDSRRLEKVMVDFVAGKHQVLISTSLVESGLDIPRANTILVMHADHFGLAQLYQLRGRVGRSRKQAYCYFMVDSLGALTVQAKKRLAALERLSRLGSSFNLATEDLEIRGAGDVLGKKQSGQVAAVGFETYFELLEEAVAALKGEPITRQEDCDLGYDLPAYVPDDWMPEPGQRLHYYQALAQAEDDETVDNLVAEMHDLFGGPVPDEVEYLAELSKLKQKARRLGAERLELSGQKVVLTLRKETPLSPKKVLDLIKSDGSFSLTRQYQLIKKIGSGTHSERIERTRNALQRLKGCVNQTRWKKNG